MKPTRLTQPYRSGIGRGPSPVLDAMRRGRAAPGTGQALLKAARGNVARRGRRTGGVRIPSSPLGRNIRARWPVIPQR